MGSIGEGKVVCVTGASGFIASRLVMILLNRGYTVKASVREPRENLQRGAIKALYPGRGSLWNGDPKKTQHLVSLRGAKERLHLFKADLLEEGSFDSVVDGCDGVFHTASPFYLDTKDPQAELIDPAVKGTLNVLNSCTKSSSVKRVVVTSSMAAVYNNDKPRTHDVTVDETWFSDPQFCKDSKMWYALSKTMAEEAAWKFAEEKGLDMVTINPSMVIGPLLQPALNTSAAAILSLINGAKTFPNMSYGWVNVKDVANAHIQAFEVPSANGRYCMVERVTHLSEVVNILRELYPNLQLPERCEDENPYVQTFKVSKEKTRSLGIDYIRLKVSIKETVESLREKGFIHF
jgi:nucleoside-diphosphate-sugar epimerase